MNRYLDNFPVYTAITLVLAFVIMSALQLWGPSHRWALTALVAVAWFLCGFIWGKTRKQADARYLIDQLAKDTREIRRTNQQLQQELDRVKSENEFLNATDYRRFLP